MKSLNFFNLLLLCLLLFSCNTSKKIVYLQDSVDGVPEKTEPNLGIVIQPKDMLSIVVSSKTPELAAQFNLPLASYQAGSEITSSGSNSRLLGYVVDNEGNIDFPTLGKLKVAGFTRWQLSGMIKQKLIDDGQLKDPIITIEFMNFRVSVIGEVGSPGTYNVTGDRVTLFEALSLAGDLTIHGKRDNVSVIREKNNERTAYKVDLRTKNLFNSPVYYLQQNDIVYVEPNKVRAGQSTINENNFKSVSLWMSMASFLITLTLLFVK
ncbi:MAG: polysaccharide biosynthesis/export family protein [Prevotellaceae bacterium]|jgi:polysaccharide export outer membrane protein|nr:polysaccharide biosynthesis/export family protein [Prevotellaceae bacterium]